MFLRRPSSLQICDEAVGISKASGGFLRPQMPNVMERWLVCRVVLWARRRRASVVVRTWQPLEAGRRVALLLRDADGAVFQVASTVARSAAGEGHHRVEVRTPWDTALSLAAWARRAVREGGTTVLHNYVAWIKGMSLPPLKLVYRGFVPLRSAFIYKVLNAPPGVYFVEISFGGVPVLFPTKYYKYPRRDKKGGDAGAFAVPRDVLRTFDAWGLHELGADYDYVYISIWKPDASVPQQVKLAEAPL